MPPHPVAVRAIRRVEPQMPLFGLRPPIIDAAHHAHQQRGPDRIDQRPRRQQRQRRQPPEQVLRQIGRMTRPAIRPVGQDAAMREVGKAQAERHRRPGIDRRQHDQHRAPQPQQRRMPGKPAAPLLRPRMIIQRSAGLHHDERRIADQRRGPRRRKRIGAADMRIERPQCQYIADGREADVDHEHQRDQPARQHHRVAQPCQIAADEAAVIARHNRQHEGQEERLHSPAAHMPPDRLALDARLPGQPRADMPAAVARLLQIAVQPQDIGHRQQCDDRHAPTEAPHGEGEIALPIEAPHAIHDADRRPGREQAGKLGQADLPRLGERPRTAPVDPRRRMAMHLVDEQRPQDHRRSAGDQRDQRRIRSVHADAARKDQPRAQPSKARQPHAMAYRRRRAMIGQGRTIRYRVDRHGPLLPCKR
ncbi:hypothetical protein WR25_09618 [Diploscapter pachys]|uniref:Uncharacterized protein n=1 Tax=Diploscapter pachys TaxID=2018661 RepID=A0A2A2M1U6_9BILA|nr:hypothetical protein WR25_09618 [Diploscapter pachys]